MEHTRLKNISICKRRLPDIPIPELVRLTVEMALNVISQNFPISGSCHQRAGPEDAVDGHGGGAAADGAAGGGGQYFKNIFLYL